MANDTPAVTSSEPTFSRIADSLRSAIAGGGAARAIASSVALFEAGGKRLLSDASRAALRSAVEKNATRAIAAASGPLFEPVAMLGARPAPGAALVAKEAARAVGTQAARAAAKEVLKGAGKAAGIGFAVDGAVAAVEAVVAVRAGALDTKAAAKHVATEATTGALATGAGVLIGAGLVAVSGGLAAPVVFAAGAFGAIGTKHLLRRITGPRAVELRAVSAR